MIARPVPPAPKTFSPTQTPHLDFSVHNHASFNPSLPMPKAQPPHMPMHQNKDQSIIPDMQNKTPGLFGRSNTTSVVGRPYGPMSKIGWTQERMRAGTIDVEQKPWFMSNYERFA